MLERFGRFKRILTPGLHFVIPLVDTPRECHWMYIDARSGFRVSHASPLLSHTRAAHPGLPRRGARACAQGGIATGIDGP